MKKKRLFWILKFAVGIVLISVLYREVNKGEAIISAFRGANWVNMLICFSLLIPNFFIQFLKWRYILRTRFPEIDNRIPLESLLFGATLGFITPGNLGELARGLFFQNYDRLVVTGLNVIDKLFGIIIFLSIGFISLNIIMLSHFNWPLYVVLPVMVLSLVFLITIWIISLNPQGVRSFLYGVNTMLPAREKIKSFISCLDSFRRTHSIRVAFLSLLWFLIIFLQYHVLVLAFTNVSIVDSFLSVSAVLFTKVILPISFADLGIREGASVFYYTLFGVPRAAAFNAALLIFVINFLFPALVGSYYVFKLKWGSNND
ncbi:MAG: hypothetical protein Kow0042_29490 [Calditrichia bacterium]